MKKTRRTDNQIIAALQQNEAHERAGDENHRLNRMYAEKSLRLK